MSFERRKQKALRLMGSTAIWRSNYCPPIMNLLWRMGCETPLPHFIPFGKIAMFHCVWFSIVWGTFMWFYRWRDLGMSEITAVSSALIGGATFGLLLGAYYARGRRRYRLPRWDELD